MSDVTIESVVQQFEKFFGEHEKYRGEIYRISLFTNTGAHYEADSPQSRIKSIAIDVADVERSYPVLVELIRQRPLIALYAAECAIRNMMPADRKINTHARFFNFPQDNRVPIRWVGKDHIGKLISVKGIVRRITEPKPKIVEAVFQCKRCGAIVRVPQTGDILAEPLECPKDQGGCGKPSSQTAFSLLSDPSALLIDDPSTLMQDGVTSTFENSQIFVIEEQPEGLRTNPAVLPCHVEDDLINTVNPGDRLLVNGVFRVKKKREGAATSTHFKVFLDVNSVEVQESGYETIVPTAEDEKEARQFMTTNRYNLLNSLSDLAFHGIQGLDIEKQALVLQQVGGVPRIDKHGNRIRGDIHVLLIGDPGCGKSEMIIRAVKVAPIAQYVAKASGPGLTVAFEKDDLLGEGRYTMRAGVVVMADHGLAGIDELDKIPKEDLDYLPQAMEQQRISVAKAGLVANLWSRCAILAAANPIYGHFDEYRPLIEQIRIPSYILSRFGLIFIFKDDPNESKDTALAKTILERYIDSDPEGSTDRDTEQPDQNSLFLRKYIALARRFNPRIGESASSKLIEYYTSVRKQSKKEGSERRITIGPRQLLDLFRLSEAAAKIRFSEIVESEDAEDAIRIFNYYLTKLCNGGQWDIGLALGYPSAREKELMNHTLTTIADMAAINKEGAKLDDVVIQVKKYGFDEKAVKDTVIRLRREGEIFERKEGYFKISKKKEV